MGSIRYWFTVFFRKFFEFHPFVYACIYMCVWLGCAVLYTLIPTDFFHAYLEHETSVSQQEYYFIRMLYFSTVTITTLGYGDVVPLTTQARVAITMEAMAGIILIGLFLNALARNSTKMAENKINLMTEDIFRLLVLNKYGMSTQQTEIPLEKPPINKDIPHIVSFWRTSKNFKQEHEITVVFRVRDDGVNFPGKVKVLDKTANKNYSAFREGYGYFSVALEVYNCQHIEQHIVEITVSDLHQNTFSHQIIFDSMINSTTEDFHTRTPCPKQDTPYSGGGCGGG